MKNNALTVQKWISIIAILQFFIKITAWYLTDSLAILSDALESIINIIGAVAGLIALRLAMKPKDMNHPYGHGKIEFLSSAFEGLIIGTTGLIIIYESIVSFKIEREISSLDYGVLLILVSGLVNFVLGKYAIKKSNEYNSLQLSTSGHHLLSDGYTTMALVVGLIILYFTNIAQIDNIIALLLSIILIITSYKILRKSLAGILDEADDELLDKVILFLNKIKNENWVDLHNLRIIKYGSTLHFDCHLTVPWYFNVNEAHAEVDALEKAIRNEFGDSIEMFVHTDGCMPFSCKICTKHDCTKRISPFEKKIEWTLKNIKSNQKHSI